MTKRLWRVSCVRVTDDPGKLRSLILLHGPVLNWFGGEGQLNSETDLMVRSIDVIRTQGVKSGFTSYLSEDSGLSGAWLSGPDFTSFGWYRLEDGAYYLWLSTKNSISYERRMVLIRQAANSSFTVDESLPVRICVVSAESIERRLESADWTDHRTKPITDDQLRGMAGLPFYHGKLKPITTVEALEELGVTVVPNSPMIPKSAPMAFVYRRPKHGWRIVTRRVT